MVLCNRVYGTPGREVINKGSPGFAGIDGFVNTVAVRDAVARIRLAAADPDDGGEDVGRVVGIAEADRERRRDRDRGPRIDLTEIVHRQTQATAEAVGLDDRGVVAPGYRADLNLVDLDALGLLKVDCLALGRPECALGRDGFADRVALDLQSGLDARRKVESCEGLIEAPEVALEFHRFQIGAHVGNGRAHGAGRHDVPRAQAWTVNAARKASSAAWGVAWPSRSSSG